MVTLDQQLVDRQSRMDALQSQAMAQAIQNRRHVLRRGLLSTLQRLKDDNFGFSMTVAKTSRRNVWSSIHRCYYAWAAHPIELCQRPLPKYGKDQFQPVAILCIRKIRLIGRRIRSDRSKQATVSKIRMWTVKSFAIAIAAWACDTTRLQATERWLGREQAKMQL